jgi:ubiquinol oxidase
MIMESLGGDQYWLDRFMAGHASVIYYFLLCILFFFNPKVRALGG